MADELKPCPFCGGAACEDGESLVHGIHCTGCPARIFMIAGDVHGGISEVREKLRATWNARSSAQEGAAPTGYIYRCGDHIYFRQQDDGLYSIDRGKTFIQGEPVYTHPCAPQQEQAEADAERLWRAENALRNIETACNYSPYREADTWDAGLAALIHQSARLLAASPLAASTNTENRNA